MNDRPLTLVLIAVAVLVALYVRRTRLTGETVAAKKEWWVWAPLFDEAGFNIGKQRLPRNEMLTTEQMVKEGAMRGVWWDPKSKPMTREQFEQAMGPVAR